MSLNLKAAIFYSPEEVAVIFGQSKRWVYRHSAGSGFLVPHARRFGKQLFFVRGSIDKLTQGP